VGARTSIENKWTILERIPTGQISFKGRVLYLLIGMWSWICDQDHRPIYIHVLPYRDLLVCQAFWYLATSYSERISEGRPGVILLRSILPGQRLLQAQLAPWLSPYV
jgi:hypothetical protein